MNNRENSLLIFAPIIKFKRVSSFITLCDLLLYAALAKSTKTRHIFIYTSIVSIRSFINQSRFTSSHVIIPFHSNFLHISQLRSIRYYKKREKILKFASYFCYSTFLQRQEKKNTLYFIRRKTPLVIKKKEIEMILASEKTRSKAWHFVVERQTK